MNACRGGTEKTSKSKAMYYKTKSKTDMAIESCEDLSKCELSSFSHHNHRHYHHHHKGKENKTLKFLSFLLLSLFLLVLVYKSFFPR